MILKLRLPKVQRSYESAAPCLASARRARGPAASVLTQGSGYFDVRADETRGAHLVCNQRCVWRAWSIVGQMTSRHEDSFSRLAEAPVVKRVRHTPGGNAQPS